MIATTLTDGSQFRRFFRRYRYIALLSITFFLWTILPDLIFGPTSQKSSTNHLLGWSVFKGFGLALISIVFLHFLSKAYEAVLSGRESIFKLLPHEHPVSVYVKQAEKIIEEQEFRFRSIFDNLDQCIIIVDLNGRILLFNKAAESLDHFRTKGIKTGLSFLELASPERAAAIKDTFEQVVKIKITVHYTVKYDNPNTTEPHWFSVQFNPVFNGIGEVVQVCIVARDITEQKVADRKLTNEKNLLRTLLDHLPDYVYVKDKNLRHIANNMAYIQLIGAASEEETLGNTTANNFSPALSKKFEAEDLQVVNSGNPRISYEQEFTDELGRKHCLLTTKIPLKDKHGNVTGLVGISRDITELVDARKELENKVRERTRELNEALANERELGQMKSKFVSITSHEFRTPLSTISLSAGYLKKFHERLGKEQLYEKISTIENQVNHMTCLLDDVLTLSKSEAGKVKIHLQPVDLNKFLQGLSDEVSYSRGDTHTVELITTTPIEISSDEKLLRNIFINLINNAIKFSPGKDKVFIEVKKDSGGVSISVRDQGMGIEPDDVEKIFQPFHRGENILGIEGTGLGLSIVKKAVELLGGEIKVYSVIGKGSIFTVNFLKI